MKLYFNYSIDCELPPNTDYTGPERRPFFHGPPTWEFADASVRGFVERMNALDVRAGATLFVYPDVAQHQRKLYTEMANAGVEIALHLNGLRYSRLRGDDAKWLGEMTCDQQREALRAGKADLEDAIGRSVTGYRACYGSASDDTFPLCEELGFTWTSNASNRYRPDFFANWSGSWRYAHRASRRSKLICGDMALYEIPVTVGIHIYYDESIRQPLDLRVETPSDVLGDDRAKLRAIIEENLTEMDHRAVPVRAIIGASHNTSLYGDRSTRQSENLGWTVRHARDLAAQHELAFTAAPFEAMLTEANRIDAW